MIRFEPGEVVQDTRESPAYAFVSVDFGITQADTKGPRIAVIGETTLEALTLREHILDKLNTA